MMLITLAIIGMAFLLFCAPVTLATEYYVSNSGDDENSGRSPSQAWRSLAKVNAFKFAPGDVVRFERGGVWRGQLIPCSGDETGYVTYTSYGIGPKPLLLGSVERNRPDDWKQVEPNIWQAGPFPLDVGNIIFNNGETCGIKVWEQADLDGQNKFYFDRDTRMVRIYSEGNPAQLYDDIECALKRHIIDQGGKHHIIYDGLQLAYGAAHGIGGGNTHHIIVRNCDLCFIGGGHQFTRKTEKGQHHVRYGNGIEFWNGAHDNLVENCRIWEIYDAGLTNQGNSKNQQYNIIYRNNIIWNCEYSFEYWNRPETSVTHDIYFENNICFNAGRGWSHGQPYKRGRHLMFFSNTANTFNFYVRNNIFHGAEDVVILIYVDHWNGLDRLIIDGNIYCQPSDRQLVRWGKPFLARDFEAYQKFTGKDANSRLVAIDRLVMEPDSMNLHVGESRAVKVKCIYPDGTSVDVTYFVRFITSKPSVAIVSGSSPDSDVPRVENFGLIRALRPGKTEITAMLNGVTTTAIVAVSE
ncbi:TPA: hypothetical protein ENG04_13025 [Candidatus Poribacteria bacterium]|nr:hypothetical protein [Candidatus Poribacteria bacterium]HEX30996.1 hypothetical protein [Candidatus Poribacteria bacterium]